MNGWVEDGGGGEGEGALFKFDLLLNNRGVWSTMLSNLIAEI